MDIFSSLFKNIRSSESLAIQTINSNISYKSLLDRIEYIQKELKHRFIYAVYMKKDTNLITTIFAAWRSNSITTILSIHEDVKRQIQMIKELGVRFLISDCNIPDCGYTLVKKIDQDLCIYEFNLVTNELELGEDILMLMKTSGTVKDKFVLVNKNMIMTSVDCLLRMHQDAINNFIRKNGTFCEMVSLPLTSASQFFSHAVATLSLGGILLTQDNNFHPLNIVNTSSMQKKIYLTSLTPTFLNFLINTRLIKRLNNIETLIVGGEKSSVEFLSKIRGTLTNVNVINAYGLTETLIPVTSYLGRDKLLKSNSVGYMNDITDIKIVNSFEQQVESLEEGSILLKGSSVSEGYVNEKNVLREGWLDTGDVGYMDNEGLLYITGRKKNIAVVNGRNISLSMIEDSVKEISGILRCVASSKDSYPVGEEVSMKVFIDKNYVGEDILKLCKEKISKISVPVKLEVYKGNSFYGMGKGE